MNKKTCKEWNIDALWGKLAMVSWGNPENPPMLLLHGFMDSAATFIPLVDRLPDTYYYVAVDFPGYGKSDYYPPGPLITHVHFVEVVRKIVQHMQWETFVCVTHSAGFIVGMFYNYLFPGKISKIINVDPGPTFPPQYVAAYHPDLWAQHFIQSYYENYSRFYPSTPKLQGKDDIVKHIAQARKIPEEIAEVVLSRSLIHVGNGLYKTSWDPRMIKFSSHPLNAEILFHVLTKNTPPMLNFLATSYIKFPPVVEEYRTRMLNDIEKTVPHCLNVTVNGEHDLHLTSLDVLVPQIIEFLKKDFKNLAKGKL